MHGIEQSGTNKLCHTCEADERLVCCKKNGISSSLGTVGMSREQRAAHGGDSSRFLSGSPNRPSCYMHAFYTQSRIFRNFSACSAFPKLAFCSAKGGLVGLVLGGHNSGSFGLIACAVGLFGLSEWPISPTGNPRAPTAAGHGHILKCCAQIGHSRWCCEGTQTCT